ncbi:MAG: hypothetical protein JJE13_06050 [Thermoleophilia bacterium]|nr:hypothetical protein [Thermoleophilia bacterium]
MVQPRLLQQRERTGPVRIPARERLDFVVEIDQQGLVEAGLDEAVDVTVVAALEFLSCQEAADVVSQGLTWATLLGYSEGGPMSILFAATYPERTEGLIIYGSFPNGTPLASSSEITRITANFLRHWGEGHTADLFAPSIGHDPEQKALVGVYGRPNAQGFVTATRPSGETTRQAVMVKL